ncbi:alkaline phosphatase D family protein [Corynebacterium glucuronolyticum]
MSSENTLSRRRFMAYSALITAGTAVASTAVAQHGPSEQSIAPLDLYNQASRAGLPFLHSVASGDPLPDSIILWTRVTPDRDSLPGSGLGPDVTVRWDIATDTAFTDTIGTGTAIATAEHDHTVHIDVKGLRPETIYYYRFIVLDGDHRGATSPIGRTKTAPAYDSSPEEITFATASCANWECGYFSAYRDMAQRGYNGELDLVVFLGDYIYEYATGEYAGKSGISRVHHPQWEITTLEDYRIRYGTYRTDPFLQAAHASTPWVVTWDDHETANNSWSAGAENHTDDPAEGMWTTRRDNAQQAYFEWLPVRVTMDSPERHIYRSFQYGDLMELTMMDLRSYRDAETDPANFANPERTMLGSEQFNWLKNVLETSTAAWNVLGNSVMLSPMKILTVEGDPAANAALNFVDQRTTGMAVNSDQWDGYAADRDRLLELLSHTSANTFVVTGDIHSEWANSVIWNDKEIGAEMVCTSISAPNVDEILTSYLGSYHPENNSTSLLVEDVLTGANPWVKHLDFDAHGYCIAHLSREQVVMDYVRVADVETNNAATNIAVTKTWRPGEGFVD